MVLRLLAVVLATSSVVGCSSGAAAKPSPSPTFPSTTAASGTSRASTSSSSKATSAEAARLATAVRAYSDAYLSGNGTAAHTLLSSRCKQRLTLAQMKAVTSQAKNLYGQTPIVHLDVQVNGDLARATYSYAVPALKQTREPWVRESGSWHEDDC